MADDVTVQLTADGPVRYRSSGDTHEQGDDFTVPVLAAERLCARDGFEYVDCSCPETAGAECVVPGCQRSSSESPGRVDDGDQGDGDIQDSTSSTAETATCVGNDGDCSRSVDEPGGYCWQHAPDDSDSEE